MYMHTHTKSNQVSYDEYNRQIDRQTDENLHTVIRYLNANMRDKIHIGICIRIHNIKYVNTNTDIHIYRMYRHTHTHMYIYTYKLVHVTIIKDG